MNTFTVETNCGTHRDFETRREAERGMETHLDLCQECEEADVQMRVDVADATNGPDEGPRDAHDADAAHRPPGSEARSIDSEDDTASATRPVPPDHLDLPDSMLTDPLDVIPDYMVDVVEGQPTINKRGYAVIAHHFDIVVQAEAITTAGETDHEYAEFMARAWKKEDGPECAYTGHATARASEARRGVADNLNEMAETRAMKRAVAWASGVGILAWEELAGYLDDERAAAP